MKKKLLILFLCAILLFCITGCGSKETKKNAEVENEIEVTDWMKKYTSEIKSLEENSNLDSMELQLIYLEQQEFPIMAVRYVTDKTKMLTLLNYTSDEKVNTKTVEETVLKLLYNRKNDNYELFAYTSSKDVETYESLLQLFNLEKSEKYELEDSSSETSKKFKENYLDIDVELESGWIDCFNKSEKEIYVILNNEIERNNTIEKIVTDDIVSKKDAALKKEEEEKIAAEKKAKEEAEKKEAERKAKEEAEKKAGYKIGNYTLKYGKYKVYNTNEVDIEITLSLNNKCHYKGNDVIDNISKKIDQDCTYTTSKSEYYGVMTYFLVMTLNDGRKIGWQMQKNNEFNDQWLMFKYVG